MFRLPGQVVRVRGPCGDAAMQRYLDDIIGRFGPVFRRCFLQGDHIVWQIPGGRGTGSARQGIFRLFQYFQRAGPIWQPADKAAFFKRGNQAVNA